MVHAADQLPQEMARSFVARRIRAWIDIAGDTFLLIALHFFTEFSFFTDAATPEGV